MGDMFSSKKTSESQSGYSNLPENMQMSADTLTNTLGQQTNNNLGTQDLALKYLGDAANPSNLENVLQYYDQTMNSTDLSQNPYYTSAIGAISDEYNKATDQVLSSLGGQQVASGQFYSTNAGNQNAQATDTLNQTFSNELAKTALSASENAQNAGLTAAAGKTSTESALSTLANTLLSGANLSEQELMNFLASMAGSSSASYGGSTASDLANLGLSAATLALLA